MSGKLTGGLKGLAKGRKVKVVDGYGKFTGPNMIEVDDNRQEIHRLVRPVHHRRWVGAGRTALHPA